MMDWLTKTLEMKATIEIGDERKECWQPARSMITGINIWILSLFFSLVCVSDADASGTSSVSKAASGAVAARSKDTTFGGTASWYGNKFEGKKTASGEIFRMNKCSGAHRTLHLVTKLLVENPKNGKSAVVRVNDRGPFGGGRVMDLSREAAIKTGIFQVGVGYIECTVIGQDHMR